MLTVLWKTAQVQAIHTADWPLEGSGMIRKSCFYWNWEQRIQQAQSINSSLYYVQYVLRAKQKLTIAVVLRAFYAQVSATPNTTNIRVATKITLLHKNITYLQ